MAEAPVENCQRLILWFLFLMSRAHPALAKRAAWAVVRTRVPPREELGEEGVIVCQRLAGCGGVVGCLAGGVEAGELVRSLLVLLPDLVCNGACGRWCVSHAREQQIDKPGSTEDPVER